MPHRGGNGVDRMPGVDGHLGERVPQAVQGEASPPEDRGEPVARVGLARARRGEDPARRRARALELSQDRVLSATMGGFWGRPVLVHVVVPTVARHKPYRT